MKNVIQSCKILSFLIIAILIGSTANATFTLNVMAPLAVGDIRNPNNPSSEKEWQIFRNQLQEMKKLGVFAVSTDVWWGIVQENKDNQFDWRYYDRLSNEIQKVGLKWVPILSFHQCGGNVGDTCNFPIPSWIWKKYLGKNGIKSSDDLKYLSEDGNSSNEVVSVWATQMVLSDYSRFMKEFQTHFSNKSNMISEINVSLGPAGELRYPSYNSHDQNSGYPTRGRLQAYSRLAREGFRNFMVSKYGSSASKMEPPHRGQSPEAQDFFDMGLAQSKFGKDFFDWYSDSLLNHGRSILNEAIIVFNGKSSAFRGIDIGAKIPGVHWRASIDRTAELAAGLVRTSSSTFKDGDKGFGYNEIVRVFSDSQKMSNAPKVVLHFTCLEMDNGSGGATVGSLAKDIVFWVAQEANRQKVEIKGENALSGGVGDPHAWDNMINAAVWGPYQGLTILRINDLAQNEMAKSKVRELLSKKMK
jgi:beta-amylase